jgi:hypothetical protein
LGVRRFFFVSFYFFLWACCCTLARKIRIAQVDDACVLGSMAALSFNAKQARKAEWYTKYPRVRCGAISKRTVQRVEALGPPRPFSTGKGAGAGALKHLDARAFSAYAGITCAAVGGGRAAMSMIANVARSEIEWQLHIKQPLYSVMNIGIGLGDGKDDDAQRDRHVGTGALRVPAAHFNNEERDDHMAVAKNLKRKRSAAAEEVAEQAPDSPRPPPEKRTKRGSRAQHYDRLYNPSRADPASTALRTKTPAINEPLQRPLTPPAGPVAAFLYSLGMQGMQKSTTDRLTLERRRRGAMRRR